ncbi:hypothetical protein Saro_0977 [Novosphingobium aromaticivorans DSM 12444]|uniref:Uncharacterized protein n=1 Tax=Novosphingobium aromaticivorans (strain ATCC 700278 / DSM 12444 / CCUG 56034 / CIP 105152 / NBRC 16084 / F199) TaxID=279238 RepID=Q2G9Q1_NOVAD|nr:hypothetical protein [Novosphingobium aromaticivorans]ABD25422.1 hypothetical protein Saro_0977 [Novosphingobium aromaticivorans DSM 12444]SCX93052.1 hypothetical protein SAMN05660666_00307 [Novosphingobium aromaticivorans]
MTLARRAAIAVKIHCPVSAATLAAMLAGDASAIELDETAAAILAIIRADNPLGDFALYGGVVEIGLGWESFTPGAAANPALGTAGSAALSPTAILTTYAPAGSDIEPALAALMAAHPWEVPVIEIRDVELLIR